MKGIVFACLIWVGCSLSTITAQLTLVQSSPYTFQLSFSEQVQRPQFQLLFNSMQNIQYQFIGNSTLSQHFYLQIDKPNDPTIKLQVYTLIFNTPLSVGNGRLSRSCYIIHAAKSAIRTSKAHGQAIFVLIAAYFLSNFTLLGHILIEYCQMYVMLMFLSKLSATLFYDLCKGLLLLPPAAVLTQLASSPNTFVFQCLTIPLLLILLSGLVGFLLKYLVKKEEQSIICNAVLEIFTYNTFVNICNIFSFNLLYNSLQFLNIVAKNQLELTQGQKIAGHFLVYFSFLSLVAIAYLQTYILNPKIGQNQTSWQSYLQSNQFSSFVKLHEGIKTTRWYTRNNNLLTLLKKVLLASLFFTGITFDYIVIFLEFFTLYYLFTVRPFKEQLYMNIYFISRLLTFAVYMVIVLGDIYFSLGALTFNYTPAKQFLQGRDAIFLIIFLVIIGIIVRQIYQKISNLNYRIRLVREENLFKLEILEKNRPSANIQMKRKKVSRDMGDSIQLDFEDFSPTKRDPDRKNRKAERDLSIYSKIQMGVQRDYTIKRRSRPKLQDVQMSVFQDYAVKATRGSKSKRKSSKMWKQGSVLQEMVKNK